MQRSDIKEVHLRMHSIRSKLIFLVVSVIIITLGIASAIGVTSIKRLGSEDADQMLHLTATTGAMNLEQYFESVEHSVRTVSTLVTDSFEGMPIEELDVQVERARKLFGQIAYNTNGVLTYYFRIDPEVSKDVKGFWYVYNDGKFEEHEVTDISQYDTNDTSALVWFTVPKATGEGIWLPPYYTENLGTRVISYNEPVYWEGQFVGVIGIEIDYGMLKQEVENISIYKSGYAFILDEDSKVFYHPMLGSSQLNLETIALEESEVYIGSNHIRYTYEGVEKEAVWIPLSNGMRLYVCASVSEINSGWMRMIWIILAALLVILTIAIILMMRFTSHITKPLRDLTEAAMQLDEGNYDFSLEYDKDDEIGILTRKFKQLAANTKAKFTEMEELDQQKILINDRLMDCVAILRESEDYEISCNKLLQLVALFYDADRSYIFEFDRGSQRMSNTYEWCAEGIEAEISNLQNLEISIADRWIAQFKARGEFFINSTDGEVDHDSDEYRILTMQGIQSLMAAPLRLGGDIVGFLGVDNPRSNTNTLLILQAVSSFVVNQLGKQREERQKMMLSAMTDDYDVLVRSDIDRDNIAVLRANDSYLDYCPELYTYRSFSAFLDRISHLNEEEYEAFHSRVNIEHITQHLSRDHVLYHNFRITAPEGISTTYQIKIVPVGIWPKSHRVLLGIHNIEGTVRAEEKQRQMLQEALDKAEQASHAKTSFLSNMSHEIRTPMNAIIGLDNIALNDPDLTPKARDYLEKIGVSAKHLLALINDILDMSRIESGRMELKNEEFSFREFLDQIDVIVRAQCTNKGLNYECKINKNIEDYYIGDEMKLKQVLINILGNAVKFTPAPGSVTLTVEQCADFEKHRSLRFIISDTGIGMSREFIPKIFGAFSQETEEADNKFGSTGLGMTISKSIVTMMGGDITVESEKGVGSTFTVTVTLKASDRIDHRPQSELLPTAMGALDAAAASDIPSSAGLAGKMVLVVEDMEVNAEILTELLDMEDIRAERAENGKIAVDMFSEHPAGTYDAILMDIRMPVMDGLEATRAIRALDREDAKSIPIIAMTANAFDEDVQRSLQAGMNAHLTKPLEQDKLFLTLSELIK